MARRYSGRKGKSGSKKPAVKQTPTWLKYTDKEIEKLVVKLAKTGLSSSLIGLQLRDVYGIPDVRVVTGKSISQILAENKLEKQIPDDLMALMRHSIQLRKHGEMHKNDMSGKRGLELTDAKMRALIKYYKGVGRLPQNWKFDPERIKLIVE